MEIVMRLMRFVHKHKLFISIYSYSLIFGPSKRRTDVYVQLDQTIAKFVNAHKDASAHTA